MIDLKKLQQLIQRYPVPDKNYPKHVVVSLFPLISTEEKMKDYENYFSLINGIIDIQLEHNIPILTVSLGKKEDILIPKILAGYCEKLLRKAVEYKINVTIFGKWYDLQGELVETLKKLNNETNDFDNFFLNLCINYDPKQEIVDACRVVLRKIISEKDDIDSFTPEKLKENIYSSYFIPPDFIIEPSKFSGTFLFDSPGAKIYFVNKPVLDIVKMDIQKAFQFFAEG
jgi:undecaprenyl pyrophosphate synthase